MKHLRKKLREERGVTLLMALLLVFVAVMVSAVVVSAALTASHRVTDDYNFEQSYQTVTSAASVVKTAIEESAVKHTKTKNLNTLAITETWTAEGKFGEELKSFLKNDARFPAVISDPSFLPENRRSYVVTADGFNDVEMKLSITYDEVNEKFKLEMECEEADAYTSGHLASVTLDMTVNQGTPYTISGGTEEVTETTYSWKAN